MRPPAIPDHGLPLENIAYFQNDGVNTIFVATNYDDKTAEPGVLHSDLDKQEITKKYPYPNNFNSEGTSIDEQNKIIYILDAEGDIKMISFDIETKKWTQLVYDHQYIRYIYFKIINIINLISRKDSKN